MASNTIGIGIEKTQDTIKKINKVTEKINQVNKFLVPASSAVEIYRVLTGENDKKKDKVIKRLKKQAKATARQFVLNQLPTQQEIIEKIEKKSCDVQVMKIVKETKIKLDKILVKSKNILNTSLKEFKELKKETDKILETLTDISLLLVIFQGLITALEILITAARISLLALTGIFASGAATVRIKEAIEKADALISEYTGAIKTYVFYVMRTIDGIISIINFIPILISLFEQLINQVDSTKTLLDQKYKDYIKNCIPGGDTINPDGTLNIENIDKFIDFNSPNLNLKTDILGDYIRDDNEQRIFRPKIN